MNSAVARAAILILSRSVMPVTLERLPQTRLGIGLELSKPALTAGA